MPRTILIEAPKPNSTFTKFKSQHILPNILLDIAGALGEQPFDFENQVGNRNYILPPGYDRYIVNISECVEKTKPDKYVDKIISQLRKEKASGASVYLSGWYAWLNRETLEPDFTVLDPLFYEKEFNKNISRPSDINPRWDLIDIENEPLIEGRKKATLRTSRGCPNGCIMCPVKIIHNKKMYFFNLEWVKEQINKLYDMGFREINFIDDNFLTSNARAKLLLKYLIDEKSRLKGMKYLFHEGMEVNDAQDIELISMLKEAGFRNIKLGVETLNEKSLAYINKPYVKRDLAIKAIENFNKIGIRPTIFIIFGLPYENEESYESMISELSKHRVFVRAQKLYNYKGTSFEESSLSDEKLDYYMNKLLDATDSQIWRSKK